MTPRISVITLSVTNLQRSLTFYRDGLGFPTDGIVGSEFEYGAVVFIDLHNGLKLALWPRSSLAHDSGRGSLGQARTGHLLGWLRGLLCRPGRSSLGRGLESTAITRWLNRKRSLYGYRKLPVRRYSLRD